MGKGSGKWRKNAGRRRVQNVPRVSHNGRISRTKVAIHKRLVESAKEAKAVVVAARLAKHKTVSEEQAEHSMLAGYELGRLRLAKKISEAKLKAGNLFAEDAARFYRLTGVPFPSARGTSIGKVPGRSLQEPDAKSIRDIHARWAGLQGCIAIYDKPQGKPIWTTLINLCVLDQDTSSWPHHMEAFIHKGLRALAVFYGVGAQDVDSESEAA